MPSIKLKCSDGRVFEVDVEVAKVSQTLKTMLEHLGVEDGEEIPLPKIDSAIFEKVLEWAERHKGDPRTDDPLSLRDRDVELDQWDREFLDVDQATLFDLITAANFLDMKGLCDAACKTVADVISGKTPDQIRAAMGIENDFSPEEEERIRMENEWSEQL